MRSMRSVLAAVSVVGCGGETVMDAGLDGGLDASRDARAEDAYVCEPNGTVCTDCRCECCSGYCGGMADGGGVDYCLYRCVNKGGGTCNDDRFPCCPGQGVCNPVTQRCK